ncbi:MAG TPA: serine hydrolase domain-containing protein [Pyrinomonadaceae bacterium]|nr:serine hydrolase domain-containing protein [Pyrinomonadaceae bacterium]
MNRNARAFATLALTLLLWPSPAALSAPNPRGRAALLKGGRTGAAGVAAPRQAAALPGLRQYVEGVMKEIPVVPGLAVAVVRGDEVIFAEGFGYRDLKAKLPVGPRTRFYIASTTKSFTATAARMLADEGKLDLDAPIKNYFPSLVLKAPLSTEQISVRDLLTHRHGIRNEPVQFRTAYTGQFTDDEIFRLLAEATSPITPEFRYSNVGYIVAAYAMEKVAGAPWQKLVEQKILAPLGMGDTSSYASAAEASSDYALPYLFEGGTFVELPYKEDNTMHAAGGMVSSARDLARWLVMNMNGGRYEGRQVIGRASLEEILAPQINQKRDFYKFGRYAYGLGWNIGTYEGDKLLHCFGEFNGFRPHVSFMPEHRIGVVVLANESRDALFIPDLIASDIYDHLLRKRPFDAASNPKVKEYAAMLQKQRDERAKRAAAREREREAGGRPAHAAAAYAGEYRSPRMGSIRVEAAGDSLTAKFGNLSGRLEHYRGDQFIVTFIPGEPFMFSFKGGAEGVAALSVNGEAFEKVG